MLDAAAGATRRGTSYCAALVCSQGGLVLDAAAGDRSGGKAEGDWGLSTSVKLVRCRTSACWPVSVVALGRRCRLFRYRLVKWSDTGDKS